MSAHGRHARRSAIAGLVTLLATTFGVAVANVGVAHGELYTFAFTGEVTSVRDGLGAFGSDASALTTFSGTYTFDSATPPATPLPPGATEALYQHRSPPAGISLQLNSFVFETDATNTDFRILVRDGYGQPHTDLTDHYGIESYRNVAAGLQGDAHLDVLEIYWLASTTNDGLFADLSIPVVPPNLAVLGPGEFRISGECYACPAADPMIDVRGVLTSLTLDSGAQTGDLNGDGRVDLADVSAFAGELGWQADDESSASPRGDINGDGRVDLADLMLLHAHLSSSAAQAADAGQPTFEAHFVRPATGVPEPPSLALTASALLSAITICHVVRRRHVPPRCRVVHSHS